MSAGKIVQIIGAVIDVEFPREHMPKVFDALTVARGRRVEADQAVAGVGDRDLTRLEHLEAGAVGR